MIARIIACLSVAALVTSCTRDRVRVQTRSLARPNPTTYSFPLPVQEVHAKGMEAFSTRHQAQEPIFGRPSGSMYFARTLFPESATNAILAKDIFTDPANANDFYLHTDHTPFVFSSVYHGHNRGLPFLASFHIHLAAAGSNTAVSVQALNTQIINGEKFGIGSCGPGYAWIYEKVKPTTVEEYSILRYFGRYLSVTNMPEIILPEP